MTEVTEKLKSIAKPSPSGGWKEKARLRNRNKAWLKKSSAIALKILDALDAPNWSQARLARELAISPQMVSKIVKGSENFTLESITKIEAILNIELISILSAEEVIVERQEMDSLRLIKSAIIVTEFKQEKVMKTTKSDGGSYLSTKSIENTHKKLSIQNKSTSASKNDVRFAEAS